LAAAIWPERTSATALSPWSRRNAAIVAATSCSGPAGVAARHSSKQVRHHLGIRLRAEPMTDAHEWLTELAVVGDDAIVDEREPARAVQVRMGVVLRHAAMRGPACVPDADRARRQVRRRLADLADALLDDDPVMVADGYSPRVVAPILELLEAAQNEVRRVLASRNSIRLRS